MILPRNYLFHGLRCSKCVNFLQSSRNLRLAAALQNFVNLSHTVYNPDQKVPSPPSLSPPLLITHGLLGSKTNWNSIAKAVTRATNRQVVVFDARNHGDSPHVPQHGYDVMAEDVLHLVQNTLKVEKFTLMGHSMGGRTAMALALRYPTLLEKLVVVDVSPVSLQSQFHSEMQDYIRIMMSIDFTGVSKLSEARKIGNAALTELVPQASIRAFLLTNLYESNNQIAWKPNLPILHEAVGSVGLFPEDLMSKRFESPSLFIRGAKSSYIPDTDIPEIKKLFPAAKFDTIQGSGHWPHADNVKAFLDSLLQFLKL
ncbi:protein ABHD11 [Folsomia candida]|uniref:protein ABHD11 n=1 Tax=Folsomia candida TaxID=158441 RepID=UPI000B9064B6|nr:protein ABHD11 [Folsomia candida]